MFWSQSLVPVAAKLLILSSSLLVLFLYYIETIWQLSVYLHDTLELGPKVLLLTTGIGNSEFSYSRSLLCLCSYTFMTILPMSFPHQMAAQHLQKQGVQKSLKTWTSAVVKMHHSW